MVAKRMGHDPSYTPRKKKLHFKTAADAALQIGFTSGFPTSRAIDGGIKYFSININNLKDVWGSESGNQSADGFFDVATDFNEFFTIGGRVTFSFDMINTAGCKLYMLCSPDSDWTDQLPISTDTATIAAADPGGEIAQKFYRKEIITFLEERVDKKLVAQHWLQRGDGYHSIGKLSLNYKPLWLDPSRGKIFDDSNSDYRTTTLRTGTWDNFSVTANASNKNDYIHIILVPNSDEYNETFQQSDTAMVWGKIHVSQIVMASLNDTDSGTLFQGRNIEVQPTDMIPESAAPPIA